MRSWRYCVDARLKFWRRSHVPKKGVMAPPSNLTRLYYNGSAAKSHSTTTQYRQLRRLIHWIMIYSVIKASGARGPTPPCKQVLNLFRKQLIAFLARSDWLLNPRISSAIHWFTSSSSERAKANNQNGFPRFAAVTNKDISQIIKQADLSVSRRSIICLGLRL